MWLVAVVALSAVASVAELVEPAGIAAERVHGLVPCAWLLPAAVDSSRD